MYAYIAYAWADLGGAWQLKHPSFYVFLLKISNIYFVEWDIFGTSS